MGSRFHKPVHDVATPLLRISHIMAFTSFLHDIGSPFEKYLESSALPVACDDVNRYVTVRSAWAFFGTAEQAEDQMLAWHIGNRAGDHQLNTHLLWRVEHSPTLYEALHIFLDMKKSEATSLQMGISERQDDILLFTRYPNKSNLTGYHAAQAYQISVVIGLIRHFLGESWIPTEIGIERKNVPTGLENMYPGCRIFTGQAAGYVAVPRHTLHRNVCSRSTIIKSDVNEALEGPDDTDLITVLQELLKSYLPDGYLSAAMAANLLEISERTFARKLIICGLTYGSLVDRVRLEMAKELLRDPDMKIRDVAMSIGFDDQSNFGRMFRRLTGLSPKQYSVLMRH